MKADTELRERERERAVSFSLAGKKPILRKEWEKERKKEINILLLLLLLSIYWQEEEGEEEDSFVLSLSPEEYPQRKARFRRGVRKKSHA